MPSAGEFQQRRELVALQVDPRNVEQVAQHILSLVDAEDVEGRLADEEGQPARDARDGVHGGEERRLCGVCLQRESQRRRVVGHDDGVHDRRANLVALLAHAQV